MQSFTAALIQMNASASKADNLARATTWAEEAVRAGAKLVALPEVWFWRGKQEEEADAAEALDGPTGSALAALAKRLGIFLLGGSILEKVAGEARPANTSLLFGPDGARLAAYRKIHLFDVNLPDKPPILESRSRAPGARAVLARTEIAAFGLSICYDLRFPELYRALARAGAEALLVPSAFTSITGKDHWEPLLKARAIENGCYVLAPDQIGPSPMGVVSHGRSMIVDPWGTVVAQASDGEGWILAPLEEARVREARMRIPALTHLRPEAYRVEEP